jgi:FlaA1/EpsC-like NDP-sugar epimerase
MKSLHLDLRALAAALHDAIAIALAVFAASVLLDPMGLTPTRVQELLAICAVAIPLQVVVNVFFGLYQGVWRYTSLPDIQRIVFATLSGTVLASAALRVAGLESGLGWREYLLYPVFLVGLMSLSRMAFRSFKEWTLYGRGGEQGTPVVIMGAGDAAVGLAKELSRSHEWRVVGMLDDDEKKRGRLLHGVRVIGPLEDLPRFAQRLKLRHAIIAMPSVPYKVRRRVVEICKRAKVAVMTVPTLNNVVQQGKGPPARIRKVAVEDLMKREPVTLDDKRLHELITGQVILVTGAGGSIGAELCRQIAAYEPAMLVLFELNEYAMYKVDEELREAFPDLPIASVMGDIKNARRVNQVMHQYSPALVFDAAAYKHVPLMEEANAWEAVQNNVFGTYVVARAAIDYGVKKFVFVSTDKAVNPTNVMGATKRLAEMVCQALQAGNTTTRFEMVRFGNVLGSAGSVIPKFQEQIDKGGPVTVTHPEMVRYFMSIPEAAQLVLQAGSMGLGGEIFVMDMGEPIKIVDLARDMIRLSELSESEIRIVYTGLRPGEKLFEELLADDEHTRPTPHPKLRIAKAREVDPDWLQGLLEWLRAGERIPGDSEVRRDLKRWVPEYQSQVRPKLTAVPPPRAAGGSAP